MQQDWKSTFERVKNNRQPFEDKWNRQYSLYRAYRLLDEKYRYKSRTLPPIGFQIIETIKPRLASLKTQIKFFNVTGQEQTQLDEWDNLINWQLEENEFADKKIEWIHNALLYGDGYLLVTWNEKEQRPEIQVLDGYLLYWDTSVTDHKDARFLIRTTYKTKEKIKSVPKDIVDALTPKGETNYKDPRSYRYELEQKIMGIIDDTKTEPSDSGETQDKNEHYYEVMEVFDFINKKRIVYIDREKKHEENTDITQENFVNIKAIKQPHTFYGMGILEPVETLIYQIADNRNQAFTNMALTNNPVVKKRRTANINTDDIIFEPGSVWDMDRVDDVVVDRPPEISKQWLDQDAMLYKEIENTLALSEYMRGAPASSSEPIGKVELLLMQSNIRLSLLVRQYENAIADLVNIMVKLNKEKLNTSYQKIFFKDGEIQTIQFNQEMKDRDLIAEIKVDIKPEKNAQVRKQEAMELWNMFVTNNQPQTPEEAEKLQKIKQVLIRAILEEFDKDEYARLFETEKTPTEQSVQQIQPAQTEQQPTVPTTSQQQPSFWQGVLDKGRTLLGIT